MRHQYGISVAESQTFLWAKRPQLWRVRRNRCFRRLQTPGFSIKLTSKLNNSTKTFVIIQTNFVSPVGLKTWDSRVWLLFLQYNDNDNVKYNEDDDDEKLVFQSKPRQNLYSICRKTPAQFEFQKMILEVILTSWIMLSASLLLMSWIKTWQNCVKMLARCCSKEQIPSYCYQVCSAQPPGRVVRVPKGFTGCGICFIWSHIQKQIFSKLVSIHFLKECVERIW